MLRHHKHFQCHCKSVIGSLARRTTQVAIAVVFGSSTISLPPLLYYIIYRWWMTMQSKKVITQDCSKSQTLTFWWFDLRECCNSIGHWVPEFWNAWDWTNAIAAFSEVKPPKTWGIVSRLWYSQWNTVSGRGPGLMSFVQGVNKRTGSAHQLCTWRCGCTQVWLGGYGTGWK